MMVCVHYKGYKVQKRNQTPNNKSYKKAKIDNNENTELKAQIIAALNVILASEEFRNKAPGFVSALLGGSQTNLTSYLKELKDPICQYLKKLLLDTIVTETVYISDEKFKALKEAANFYKNAIDEPSSSSVEYSPSSPCVTNTSSEVSMNESSPSQLHTSIAQHRGKRVIPRLKPVSEHFIRGNIETYRNEMMGGFIPDLFDGNNDVYIDKKATIKRPTDVTGNIGRVAGDHVISFSFFVKYIESLVTGKKIEEALQLLRDKVASIATDNIGLYQPINVECDQFIAEARNSLVGKFKAFEFLKNKFIPFIIATWNQKVGTAFKSIKTSEERGKEGANIREILKSIFLTINFDNETELSELINAFIGVIDYRPIDLNVENQPAIGQIQDLLALGYRTNNLNHLIKILDDIVKTFLFVYGQEVDDQERYNIMTKIISSFLEYHGWISHFINNPQDLDRNIDIVNQIDLESLTKLILATITTSNPILFDVLEMAEGYDASSEDDANIDEAKELSKKTAEEKGIIGPRYIPRFTLADVDDQGNCFYIAVTNQMALLNNHFTNNVPIGTAPNDSLRLAIQGEDFLDRQWADDATFDLFIREFPHIILSIIDTRNPEAGFISYYMDENGDIITNVGDLDLPENREIIRLAATGNHFLSVTSHPELQNGSIRFQWGSISLNLEQILQEENLQYVEENTDCSSSITRSSKPVKAPTTIPISLNITEKDQIYQNNNSKLITYGNEEQSMDIDSVDLAGIVFGGAPGEQV